MPATNGVYDSLPPFKAAEKKIRGYDHLQDALLSGEVVDFLDSDVESRHSNVLYRAGNTSIYGQQKRVFRFYDYEGLIVIPDCLPPWQQVEIAHYALEEAPRPPNNTNLTHEEVEDVWKKEKYLFDEMGPNEESYQPLTKSHVLGRLRWCSLGFQYDWTNRRYPQAIDPTEVKGSESMRSSLPSDVPHFPSRLAQIIKDIAAAIPPLPSADDSTGSSISIEPEASIINYFPAGTTMGGHVDDAELTYDHPVISLSIGRSCIFLIGGKSKESEKPLALLLRSGHALIMHGDSRLRMHGVAKVFKCPCGDTNLVKRKAGAKKKRCAEICTGLCSSFDDLMDPLSGNDVKSSNQPLICHKSLGGVDCNSDQYLGYSSSIETSEGGCCTKCTGSILPQEEVQVVLKMLKTSRINVNVRQVYASGTRPPI